MARERERARAILGALAVDTAGAELEDAKAGRFIRSVAEHFGPQRGLTVEQVDAMTQAQRAGIFLDVLRGFILDIRRAAQANAAAEAARLAALAAVDADDAPDLGG